MPTKTKTTKTKKNVKGVASIKSAPKKSGTAVFKVRNFSYDDTTDLDFWDVKQKEHDYTGYSPEGLLENFCREGMLKAFPGVLPDKRRKAWFKVKIHIQLVKCPDDLSTKGLFLIYNLEGSHLKFVNLSLSGQVPDELYVGDESWSTLRRENVLKYFPFLDSIKPEETAHAKITMVVVKDRK